MLTESERQALGEQPQKRLNQTDSVPQSPSPLSEEADIDQSYDEVSGLHEKGRECDIFIASRYRWVILAVYSGMTFNSNMIVASFNSLVDPIVTGFGVSEAWVITMMTMSHIIYAPVSIVVSWMFKNMQPGNVYRIAACLMLLGAWSRLLAFANGSTFWVLFVANTTFTLTGPIVFNGLSIVVLSWFRENEKATATSVMGFGAQCGSFAGMAIPGVIALGLDKTNPEQDLEVIRNCVLVANCILTVICALFLILFRGKPKTPPSKIALEAEKIALEKPSGSEKCSILSKLCKNNNFICNCVIFVIFWGMQSTMAVILTPLFSPGNYTTSELSLIGVSFVLGGMIFLFVFGIVLDRTQAYLKAARLLTTSVVILAIAGIWIIPAGNISMTSSWAFVVGAFLLPIFTVSLPFTILITHPIPSDAANGIMITGSYIFATVGCLGGAAFFETYWYPAIFTFIGCVMIACIAAWLMGNPKPKTVDLGSDTILKDEEDEGKQRLTGMRQDKKFVKIQLTGMSDD